MSCALSGRFLTTGPPGKSITYSFLGKDFLTFLTFIIVFFPSDEVNEKNLYLKVRR